jgi:hypothetical protein
MRTRSDARTLESSAANLGPLQIRHDLGLGELRLAQGNLLARVAIVPEDSPCGLSTFQGGLRISNPLGRHNTTDYRVITPMHCQSLFLYGKFQFESEA